MLDIHCFAWTFSSCGKWELFFIVVYRLLTAVASLVVEHRLEGMQASVVTAHRLSSCGTLKVSDQGTHLCAYHKQNRG